MKEKFKTEEKILSFFCCGDALINESLKEPRDFLRHDKKSSAGGNMPYNDHQFQEYFESLYHEHGDALVRFAKIFLYDWGKCHEVAHEAFMRILEKRIVLTSNPEKVRNYLFTVVRNIITDQTRRTEVEDQRIIDACYHEYLCCENTEKDLEEAFIEGEVVGALYDTIEEFPDFEKDIYLNMTIMKRGTYRDLSRRKGMPLYQMKCLREKIDAAIRERLSDLWEEEPALP